MAPAKVLHLMLHDGDMNGCVECIMPNHTYRVYRIPLVLIKQAAHNIESGNAGFYLLSGHDTQTDRPTLCLGRVNNPRAGKSFFKQLKAHVDRHNHIEQATVWLIAAADDNTLNDLALDYLEHAYYREWCRNTACRLQTAQPPELKKLAPSTECALSELLTDTRLMLNALSFPGTVQSRTQPAPQPVDYDTTSIPVPVKVQESLALSDDSDNTQPILELKCMKPFRDGTEHLGVVYVLANGQFMVPQGSRISTVSAEYLVEKNRRQRDEKNRRQREEALASAENGVLDKDYYFRSPSTAALFITGYSQNGWKALWTLDGQQLHDWQLEHQHPRLKDRTNKSIRVPKKKKD